MAHHDPQLITELIPLVRMAEERAPMWVPFETDKPVQTRRALYWLINNAESPLGYVIDGRATRAVAVQWQVSADLWSPTVSKSRLVQCTRGRIRFRQPRDATA